jgi:hypothetical protein
MKRFLLPFLILAGYTAHTQAYNNEWINYSRTYYKFKVGITGLYRISQPTLAAAGIGSAPAEQFQLWRNGQQVAIYTSVQTGVMGASDYIEFWGEANDGKPDNILYRNPDFQLNNKWSLETDTAAYFLTVNPAGGNLRLVPTPNTLPSSQPADSFFVYTKGKYYKEKLNPGYAAVVGEYVYSSAYDSGEGWTSFDLTTGLTKQEPFPNLYTYTGPGATAPVLKVNASGNHPLNPRQFEVRINSTLIATQTMDFFDYVKATYPVPPAEIAGGQADIFIKNIATVGGDRMVTATIELVYPRQFNFDNQSSFEFELPANTSGNYLQITNFNHGNISPVLYDMTNRKRYVADITNPAQVKIALQPSATTRKLVLVSQASGFPVAVSALQQRNFINYAAAGNQGNFAIITHQAMTAGAGGSNPVEDYRAYRASAAGGSHTAKIFMMDQLIDQFSFGIKNNPLSIRNFLRWTKANFSSPVKNVFLIGRGVNYAQFRLNESNVNIDKLSFVPTFGSPASDVLLAAEPGPDQIPYVSIGRLSTISPDEVALYLAKVIQYEQQQAFQSPLVNDKAWMKNIVHAVGASDPGLGNLLTSSMNNFADIIKDTLYGANVESFAKVTPDPIQQSSSEKLNKLFQDGIGMITYFGHSSASTLEFNLDNPDQYNNPGKYPVMIVLGCNAGNFFNFSTQRLLTKETLSEKFVLAPQRGAIAYIASTHLGIVYYLDVMNTKTYTAASVSKYGRSIGEIMRESIVETFDQQTQNDYYARMHCEQATIHGDPSLILNISMNKPDYVVEDQLVKITPQFISVAESSFRVNAKVMNLGKAIDRDIVVEVKRTFPDLTTQVIRRDTIPGIRYADSLVFDVPIVATRDKGLNRISICVDADNVTDELYETNNCVVKDVVIYEDEARPVYPYNFGIVNNASQKLYASTANPFIGMKQYNMEMDTTEFFNSPVKITRSVTSAGGVLEFTPGITLTDSTVYYWRVAPVPVSGQPVWNKSSFVYLSNSGPNASDYGYNQSHFYQHTKSVYDRIKLDSSSRSLKFGTINNNIFMRLSSWVTGCSQEGCMNLAINGVPSIRLCNWFQSLVFNVIDPVTFNPWSNIQLQAPQCPPGPAVSNIGLGLYGSGSPKDCFGNTRGLSFEFRYTDAASRKKMMDFMKDSIPDGHYIIVRNFTLDPAVFTTWPQAFISDWQADQSIYGTGNSLYHSLKNAGFSGVDSFYRARPWGFIYKKNDAAFTPRWFVGDNTAGQYTFSVDCPSPDTLGYVTSPLFGPAKAWKQLKWRGSSEPLPGDVATLDVIGVTNTGAETTLYSNLTTSQQNFDVSGINAATYPYVKLKLTTLDTSRFTPYQLRYWRITYTPVPEGAISPNIYLKTKDSVDVGEPMDYKIAFKNISDAGFDSLKVKLVLTDRNNVPHIIPLPKRRPLPVGDTLQLGTLINTSTFPGLNTTYLEANPDNDQPEQFHFNNFAFRSLYVKPDSLNPLLDVTFDGVHILNRDIVASKPDILIKLKDEAKWMILDDTALLTLQVKYPNGSIRRFWFNNDTVRFTPAGQAPNTDNTAIISFRPYFPLDGEYEMIVSGKDKSSNNAGAIQYRVLFNVINKPMISNMLNYPNPFTTSTAFVFTITGSVVPQNIKIEIMTVTGKIVREITKDELGPLHIGRNITEFKWDGTDQYGQKLANGIYLYRVVTNLNGRPLDKYKAEGDETDKFFNKGYGKMYLMR